MKSAIYRSPPELLVMISYINGDLWFMATRNQGIPVQRPMPAPLATRAENGYWRFVVARACRLQHSLHSLIG